MKEILMLLSILSFVIFFYFLDKRLLHYLSQKNYRRGYKAASDDIVKTSGKSIPYWKHGARTERGFGLESSFDEGVCKAIFDYENSRIDV